MNDLFSKSKWTSSLKKSVLIFLETTKTRQQLPSFENEYREKIDFSKALNVWKKQVFQVSNAISWILNNFYEEYTQYPYTP